MKKSSKQSAPKLTLTRAKQLAMQELGTAKGLVLVEGKSGPNNPWYQMEMGNITVVITKPYNYCGIVQLDISSSTYIASMTALFSAETLEFDMGHTDKYHREIAFEKAGSLGRKQLLELAEKA